MFLENKMNIVIVNNHYLIILMLVINIFDNLFCIRIATVYIFRGLEACIFCLCLAHTEQSKIDISYFLRTDRSSYAIMILQTDLNSS